MTPTVPLAEEVELLTGITWEEYKRRNDAVEGRNPRMTYDGGVLEIMTLGLTHERFSWFAQRLFEELARGFRIEFESAGSHTYRREDLHKGFQGDGSYYIRNAVKIRAKETIDLSIDPPPDLVIEIDISRQSLEKLPLFAVIGIEEVWRYRGDRLRVLTLSDGKYHEVTGSRVLPNVSGAQLNDLLNARIGISSAEWLDMVQDWARARRNPQAAES